MKKHLLTNEVWALRHGEKIRGTTEKPAEGEWIAVMLRSVSMPDGEKQRVRQIDGKPVEMCAILACHLVDGKWQWLQISAVTKEIVGDYFFDGPEGFPHDTWLYLTVIPQESEPCENRRPYHCLPCLPPQA